MYSRLLVLATLSLLALPALSADAPAKPKAEFHSSAEDQAKGRPFSESVRAGDFLFLAGQIGLDPATGKPAAGGIGPESRAALARVKAALEKQGASLADVVKCTVFLADIAEWATFNDIYKEFFKAPYPARSALGANGLALGARVEVECIAYLPK